MSSGDLTDPRPGLTKRQTEVLERLELGTPVRRISADIGVTPAAVYQTIERLRRAGHLPAGFTPSGRSPRRSELPGAVVAGGARGGASAERLAAARAGGGEEDVATLIDAAIAADDAPALAYLLGRTDAGEGPRSQRPIIEAALRRLGLLPADEPGEGAATESAG